MSEGIVFVAESKEIGRATYSMVDTTGHVIASNLNVRSWIHNSFVPSFRGGYATIHADAGDAGIIDKKGKINTLKGCKEISPYFVDGVATVREVTPQGESIFYYVDTLGKAVYPALKQRVKTSEDVVSPRPFCDGLSVFYDYTNKRYGFFDKTGKIVIRPSFHKVHDFSEGLAAVTTDGENWGFINTGGEYVITPKFHNEPGDFHDGYAAVQKQNRNYVYVNSAGEPCSPEIQGLACRFYNGYALINGGHRLIYVINTEMKIVRKVTGYNLPIVSAGIQYLDNGLLMLDRSVIMSPDGTVILDVDGSLEPTFVGDYAFFNSHRADLPSGFINKEGEYILIFTKSEF